jgi:hypothetical protein
MSRRSDGYRGKSSVSAAANFSKRQVATLTCQGAGRIVGSSSLKDGRFRRLHCVDRTVMRNGHELR